MSTLWEKIKKDFRGIKVGIDEVQVIDLGHVKRDVDLTIKNLVLEEDPTLKRNCCWLIWELARKLEIYPSSIYHLYKARGKGEISGFTVPAMNLRTFTYSQARAIFRVAKKHNAGAFIFEIATSEINYTDQKPMEYTAMVLGAAIREEYKGPVFIQGDHFQINASNFHKDNQQEINKIKTLIKESVNSGFYNIDIDSSTLVDLDKDNINAQQELNYKVCAELTEFIRSIQPQGITITVGGEIGEVGKKNSTPEELRAFMDGYLSNIDSRDLGISKLSIQTGTFHGGVVLPDGSIANVNLDFETLGNLSEISRKEYNLAGCVQHGASTLQTDAFHKFPEVETAEIHLATEFQNIVYENLPMFLKEQIYEWLVKNFSQERKPEDTYEQFIYKTRKKALGPFKKDLFSLKQDVKNKISIELEKEFEFLFVQFNLQNTKDLVNKYIQPVTVVKKLSDFQF